MVEEERVRKRCPQAKLNTLRADQAPSTFSLLTVHCRQIWKRGSYISLGRSMGILLRVTASKRPARKKAHLEFMERYGLHSRTHGGENASEININIFFYNIF